MLEERIYYCQNQHADVVALVTSAGGQREMDRYSSYGVPFGLPEGDSDSNGVANATDRTIIQGWINAVHYDVRGDADLDGDVDLTDKVNIGNLGTVTLGRAELSASAVGNCRGVAGYEIESELVGSNYHIRNRVLSSGIGSWLRRDPLGYVDDTNLFEYVRSLPHGRLDPLGHESTDPGKGGERCGNGLQDLGEECDASAPSVTCNCVNCMCVAPEIPVGPGDDDPPGDPPRREVDCCAKAAAMNPPIAPPPGEGMVVCCGSFKAICIDEKAKHPLSGAGPWPNFLDRIGYGCLREHENIHKQDCDCASQPPGGVSGCNMGDKKRRLSEAYAYQVQITCIKSTSCGSTNKSDCADAKRAKVKEIIERAKGFLPPLW